MLTGKKILLVISGGIAAYKSLELIRALKKENAHVKCILTNGGSQFITPLSVAALTQEQVYTDLWSLKDETDMGHIRLSREADLIVIAPASANLMAQMAHGLAEDLASTTLLASNRPIMICPAMNPMMWEHQATQDNLKTLQSRGLHIIMPNDGDMACGETGTGRMSEPENILKSIIDHFKTNKPLAGRKAIVTSGPTFEAIDPVRFIGNRSSGKQGHAIADALAQAGASVTLITGPVSINSPDSVEVIVIESAQEMLKACHEKLTDDIDIAICAAAVADWRVSEQAEHKLKKSEEEESLTLHLTKNPDILQTISHHEKRPDLVIGFAAETQNLLNHAKTKLNNKGCDWIIANNVNNGDVFGQDENQIHLISANNVEEWAPSTKHEIARDLNARIVEYFEVTNK